MRMSKSKILMWLNCPYQFKLVVLNRVPFTSPAMTRGRYIHDILDKFFDRLDYETMHPSNFVSIFKSLMSDNYLEHYKLIQNFIELERLWFGVVPKHHYRPKLREVKLYDYENNISGVVDRIDYDPHEGRYVLWDYKTGSVTSLKKHMFEMALYAHLFKVTYPDKAEPLVGVYALKSGKKFKTQVRPEDITDALKVVKYVKEQINMRQYYRNAKANCFWCPENVRNLCRGRQ